MNILVTDPFHPDALSVLQKSSHTILYQPDISPETLLETVASVAALIVRGRTKVTKDIIEQGRQLQIIARAGSGMDNIDKTAAETRGIMLVNAKGANSQAVAELTLGLMLSLLRRIPSAHQSLQKGLWVKKELVGRQLSGKTVGIVGYGTIGKKVGELVQAFGATVKPFHSTDSPETLTALLKESDIVSLHITLNDQTRWLLNKQNLSLLKSSACLVNCARAEVIVEDDLYDLLVHKRIAGAALDVFWQEPLTDTRWGKLENVILTPHIGGQTTEASRAACMQVAERVLEIFRDK